MNKQRFVSIGCVVFFLFLAMTSLLEVENPAVGSSNQPAPVSAPAAISAPTRSTPTPAHSKQPAVQPAPQPVPTPASMSAVNGISSASGMTPPFFEAFGFTVLLWVIGVIILAVVVWQTAVLPKWGVAGSKLVAVGKRSCARTRIW